LQLEITTKLFLIAHTFGTLKNYNDILIEEMRSMTQCPVNQANNHLVKNMTRRSQESRIFMIWEHQSS